jgi:hypothetical protein
MEADATLPCKVCGDPVTVPPCALSLAQSHGVLCASCLQAEAAAQANAKARTQTTLSRGAAFERLCPPCFNDTDPARLPQPARSDEALLWRYGVQGLVLFGVKGTGKSRTMSLIIEREVRGGRVAVAFGPGDFKAGCEAREYKRGRWLRWLGRVPLLYIDDIDKMSLTRSQETDLFAVLNDRMGRLPTLITGNANGAELETKFRLGQVLVDRIRRYCYCIHFGERDKA